ncbi:cytochrome c oxidase subunit II (mitochondrion) [Fragariocoptes setiger]|uniref:Cytochrome c oxidase subunit 2 n=1 Tax=Fragariocoptes setiger TaxID=1670756 RepID=A0ABQ7SDC9_9ACAR|nr:cytochrome c oxidase subunit II [Fragariocoptes setiger]
MMTWNSVAFHNSSTVLMDYVTFMYDYVMMFLFSIIFLVLYIMVVLILTFYPSFYFMENNELEFFWTMVPFFLLIFIVVPSMFSLYVLDSCFFCGLVVKVVGHQWYWSYFYGNSLMMTLDSYMSFDSFLRLVDVDNRLVVPNNFPLRFVCTSSDVIHSWTLPSCGVKMDAVPGRLNQFCFSFNRLGLYFGQCSEICGANHSFMPIVVESVSTDFFSN